jgi:hypothetical protein
MLMPFLEGVSTSNRSLPPFFSPLSGLSLTETIKGAEGFEFLTLPKSKEVKERESS